MIQIGLHEHCHTGNTKHGGPHQSKGLLFSETLLDWNVKAVEIEMEPKVIRENDTYRSASDICESGAMPKTSPNTRSLRLERIKDANVFDDISR